MTIQSCLITPAHERFRVYKQSHLEFCEGNACAAGLIDFFERWHMKKLAIRKKNQRTNDIAEMHGEQRVQDESLFQFHTAQELKASLLDMFSLNTIRKAIKYLAHKKIISIHRNPNPRYHFDKTHFYLFHPTVFNDWLKQQGLDNDADIPVITLLSHERIMNNQGDDAACVKDMQDICSTSSSSAETQFPQETVNVMPRDTKVIVDTANLSNGKNNLGSRATNFARAITNKTNNKTKKSHNLTQPQTLYRKGAPPTSSVSEVNDQIIGDTSTDAQQQCIDAVIAQLIQKGRASNPTQLRDEFIFAMQDKHILNRCHHSFSKKLNAMANLVETKRWSTPIRLQYVRQQAVNAASGIAHVVTLSATPNPVLNDNTMRQRALKHEIIHLRADIAGERGLLERMQGTPNFAELEISVNKTIAEHQAAIEERQAALSQLVVEDAHSSVMTQSQPNADIAADIPTTPSTQTNNGLPSHENRASA